MTGEGGSGKTRLALQLETELAGHGWRTLWVERGREGSAVAAVRDSGEPAVLVVDYAETRPGLAELLAEAAAAGGCPDVRVVLLARSAVTAYRALAQARPDAFLPDLATALNNQSERLADLGRREEALAAIEEAATTYRALAQARPDAFLPDLAASLNNQSASLADLGRREEALAAIEEAATTYRALAQARPDAFLPDLAASLNNQSASLADLGRREEALAAIEEAATTYRALAQARPAVFASRYASSLDAQAAILSELGRDSEAKAVQQEAAAIRGNVLLARVIHVARRCYPPGTNASGRDGACAAALI